MDRDHRCLSLVGDNPGAGMQRIGENSTFLSAPVRSDRPVGTERRAARNSIKRGGKEKEEERRKEEERSFKKKKKLVLPVTQNRDAARNKSRAPFTTKNDGGEEYGAPLVPLAPIHNTSPRDDAPPIACVASIANEVDSRKSNLK